MTKQYRTGWSIAFALLLSAMLVGCGGSDDADGKAENQAAQDTKKSAPVRIESKPPAVTSEQTAIAALEIDFARFQQTSVGNLIDADSLKGLPGTSGAEIDVVMSLKRVNVLMSGPKNLQTLMSFLQPTGPGAQSNLPMEFRVDVEFVDAESAAETIGQVTANLQEVTLEGKKMYLPDYKTTGGPPVYIEVVSDTALRLGSKNYMKLADVPKSASLTSQWGKLPAGDFRLVLDLDSARPFFTEISTMTRENVPLMFTPFVDVIDQASYVALTSDGNSDQLLQMMIEGHNADEAANIKTVVAGLLDLGVKSNEAQLAQIRQSDPKAAAVFTSLMDSMAPRVEGNLVSVVVQKPEGFDQVMRESVMAGRAAADKMRGLNDFKQLALGILNYHDAFKQFPMYPERATADPSISWRVLILPFIEENPLYDQFDVRSSWDSEDNIAAASFMPPIFGDTDNLSSVVMIRLEKPVKTFSDVVDGTSNTIMLLETTSPVPWTKAGGITIDEAVEMVAGLEDGQELRVAYFDGSVRTISNEVSEEELRSRLDPRDFK